MSNRRRNNDRQQLPPLPQGAGQIIAGQNAAEMLKEARRQEITNQINACSREIFARYVIAAGIACRDVPRLTGESSAQIRQLAENGRKQALIWASVHYPELVLQDDEDPAHAQKEAG